MGLIQLVSAPVLAELSLLPKRIQSENILGVEANGADENSFPHAKFKWRTENTF